MYLTREKTYLFGDPDKLICGNIILEEGHCLYLHRVTLGYCFPWFIANSRIFRCTWLVPKYNIHAYTDKVKLEYSGYE